MKVAIIEDGAPAGVWTDAELAEANPDAPDVSAALASLKAGAYQVELDLGAGGKTLFVRLED